MDANFILHLGDVIEKLREMPPGSVQTIVTSPPYWGLRDYGIAGQLGLESTPEQYIQKMVDVFSEARRVLRDDGTLWLNLGDSYAMDTRGAGGVGKQHTNKGAVLGDRSWQIPSGLKRKDLVGIPWRVAFALQADGWYLRSDIIWHKPNAMPESVTDRPTKCHEYIFLLTKSERYFYDAEAIRERAIHGELFHGDYGKPGVIRPTAHRNGRNDSDNETTHRNKRTVWTVTTEPFPGAHFATFSPKLIEPCILAGAPNAGVVLDPFTGSGTTGVVALKHGRRFVGIELNPEYHAMASKRLREASRQELMVF